MRGWIGTLSAAACLIMLTACEGGKNHFLQSYAHADVWPTDFFVCHGYGCANLTRVSLADEEWREVRAAFEPPPQDGPTERRQVAKAIAKIERFAGERAGTLVHQKQAWSAGDPTQYDCIDQAVNTWTYLTMLKGEGLLRYHEVGDLAHAGSVLTADIRNTATLVAKADGKRFAIDPQLVDGALQPPIIPLAVWAGRWPPALPQGEAIGQSPGQNL